MDDDDDDHDDGKREKSERDGKSITSFRRLSEEWGIPQRREECW